MSDLTVEDILTPASPGRRATRSGPGATTEQLDAMVSESEATTAAYVMQMFREARHYRRPLVNEWLSNYQVLHNRTWGTRATWLPSPELPEIWPIVSAIVGWQTDGRATYFATPMSPPHQQSQTFYSQLGEDLVTALRASWDASDTDGEVETILWDANVYGTGFGKALWDPLKVGGLGDVAMRRVDPFTFYPDPRATSWESMNHCLEVRNQTLKELDRRYPGAARKIRDADMGRMDFDQTPDRINPSGRPTSLPNYGPIPNTAITGVAGGSSFRPASGEVQNPMEADMGVTVFELWQREHYFVKDPEVLDDEGNATRKTVERWRCTVVAGSVVLYDAPATEMWSHGQHPYERYVLQETGEFWGQSLVKLLAPAQMSINKNLAAIEHNIWLTGNPVWIEDTRSGLSRQQITNKPGQRLLVNPQSQAGWSTPPVFGSGFDPMNLVSFYIGRMEAISGLSAINRGQTPTSRNSQGVMDAVQESAFVRVRIAQRNLERFLKRIGDKLASMIVEFYDVPRMVAITGPAGEQSARALHGMHWWLPSAKGRVPMRFQINIHAGSSLPTSRQAKMAEAMQFFVMGVYDEEAVLEIAQPPHWQRTLARVREMKSRGLMQPPGARQRAGRQQ